MGLLKPIWMTENLKKRDKAIAAVQRLEDAIQLENAAINAPMEAVAQAACSRIMDQATLVEVAIHARWRRVATQAAAQIDDSSLLVKIALEAGAKGGSVAAKRTAEGRCPHCGVQLTAPRGGIADGAVVYCSNCGGRVC